MGCCPMGTWVLFNVLGQPPLSSIHKNHAPVLTQAHFMSLWLLNLSQSGKQEVSIFPKFLGVLKTENNTSAFLSQDLCFFLVLGFFRAFFVGEEECVCVCMCTRVFKTKLYWGHVT